MKRLTRTKDNPDAMYQLSNERLTVTITANGAELQSIFHKELQTEYLWSGDPAFWGKKSPVLFPIVGGLKNNTYVFKGKTFTMGRHGFAREKTFAVAEETENRIRFSLSSDEVTLQVYPFHFIFSIIYTLDQNRLTVSYEVLNRGKETMYFSVGAHPAFKVPLINGTEFADHYLQFNKKETVGKWPLSVDGLIESVAVPFLANTDTVALQKALFYGDALVFKDLRSSSITIRNHHNPHGVTVSFEGFPYMGIWSAKNSDFVCIEPWCGIADNKTASGDISEKEGIHSLEPGKFFHRNWQITVF